MIDFINDKFSSRAKNALKAAQKISQELGHAQTGTEHLLYGIVSEFSSFASEVILKNKLTAQDLKQTLASHHQGALFPAGKIAPALKAVLEKAAIVASKYQYQFIGTEHFLYGIVDSEENEAQKILSRLGMTPSDIKKNLLSIFENAAKFPEASLPARMEPNKTLDDGAGAAGSALAYFTTDLTQRAKDGLIDPLIGRSAEVQRVISILARRGKNNPVLIGEPGVGKTAIVEGLAVAIRDKKVSESLANKRILALDLALMVAGSMFRGEFENRLKQIIEEIKEAKNIVLFIDELHTLVGAGAATGSLDAANILKPALARGEIRAIGATTLSEYKKFIESDAALERRFQPVYVREPDESEALEILKGLAPFYESHHGVKITDEAMEHAIKLSVRYLPDRFLPDKAIDLVDETAAHHKILREQKNPKSAPKNIEADLADMADQKRRAVLARNFEQAVSIKNQENLLLKFKFKTEKTSGDAPQETLKITGAHIAETLSRITGLPLSNILKEEKHRLAELEKILKKKIIGQDAATRVVSSAIRRSRVGISSPSRPLGSFMFLGPSGVGKTHLAKILAEELFGDDKSLIRIDMSEFMERHNTARLIGAPAGYVGYEDGGRLTEAIRRRPYAVILFDEIEKAHPDVFNLLLQILEEGELTDAAGKKVNFRNTIIIMTSNIGLAAFNKLAAGFGFARSVAAGPSPEEVKNQVLSEVRKNFRTEFLNRIDKLVIFEPLETAHMEKIVSLELQKLAKHLADLAITLETDPEVIKYLAAAEREQAAGARAVRKLIQENVEDLLAKKILGDEIKSGQNVLLVMAKKGKQKIIDAKVHHKIPA